VHALGGKDLARVCQQVSEQAPGIRCPVGAAVSTPAASTLSHYYQKIVHTVPPFYAGADDEAERLLLSCYRSSFDEVWREEGADDTLARSRRGRRLRWGFGWQSGSPETAKDARRPPSYSCAVPLLGAGVRGVPLDVAVRVAARAAAAWSRAQSASGPTCAGDKRAGTTLVGARERQRQSEGGSERQRQREGGSCGLSPFFPSSSSSASSLDTSPTGDEAASVLLFGIVDAQVVRELEAALAAEFEGAGEGGVEREPESVSTDSFKRFDA
jgi:O-acetyl-ADP-ribose deacetylase (regulator of RNase III)